MINFISRIACVSFQRKYSENASSTTQLLKSLFISIISEVVFLVERQWSRLMERYPMMPLSTEHMSGLLRHTPVPRPIMKTTGEARRSFISQRTWCNSRKPSASCLVDATRTCCSLEYVRIAHISASIQETTNVELTRSLSGYRLMWTAEFCWAVKQTPAEV